MELLIKGATVFAGGALAKADIRIQNGTVAEVGQNLAGAPGQVLNAAGMLVSPGFTDLHVHFRQPGFEQKETIASGTAAAAAGGFTTVCTMPNLNPVPHNLENLALQQSAIERDALVWVLPYGALTVNEEGEKLADIAALAPYVAGFSDDGRGVQQDEKMREGMKRVAAAGSFVAAHCEVESLLPQNGTCVQQGSAFAQKHGYQGYSNQSEYAEVQRDARLAGETGCPLHVCHTSTEGSFTAVRDAKAKGWPVSCEVTPHNLLLCCDDISEDDGRFKMNPPLRTKADQNAALAALADGTADAIATDHAPHTEADKAGGFAKSANGVVGLETAFAALYTHLVVPGHIPLERLLHCLTAGPRGVLGLPANEITPGQPADLVLLDLAKSRPVNPETFATKGRATPFAGWELQGWPVRTFCDGEQVFWREDAE